MNQIISSGTLDVLTIIATSNLAESTKEKYSRAISGYLATGHNLTDAAALRLYAQDLSHSRRGNLKSALGLWLTVVEDELKAGADPTLGDTEIMAHVARIQAASQ